ncbi:MAG: DUF551 domain-containing protein [Clostridia bacterium]|nr:DUF551 domain-containing protein [Clostridia bacterium]
MAKWIKTSEKKPEVGKHVLCACKEYPIPFIGYYEPTRYKDKFFMFPTDNELIGIVTHWSPLPALPAPTDITTEVEAPKEQ